MECSLNYELPTRQRQMKYIVTFVLYRLRCRRVIVTVFQKHILYAFRTGLLINTYLNTIVNSSNVIL